MTSISASEAIYRAMRAAIRASQIVSDPNAGLHVLAGMLLVQLGMDGSEMVGLPENDAEMSAVKEKALLLAEPALEELKQEQALVMMPTDGLLPN